MSKELELITPALLEAHVQMLSPAETAAHVLAKLSEHGYNIVRTPTFDHMGPNDTAASTCRIAARNLRNGYDVGGSNTRAVVARLLESIAAQELEPCRHSTTMGDGIESHCMACGADTSSTEETNG